LDFCGWFEMERLSLFQSLHLSLFTFYWTNWNQQSQAWRKLLCPDAALEWL